MAATPSRGLRLLPLAGNKLQRLRLCEARPFQGGEAGIKRVCFFVAVRLIRGGLWLFGGGGLLRLFLRLFAVPSGKRLLNALRDCLCKHFPEGRRALLHFVFVERYQNIRFQDAKRAHAPAAVVREEV